MEANIQQLRFLVDTIKAKDEIIKMQQEALTVFEEQLKVLLENQKKTDEIINRIENKIS
jgi:hypothetical protein